MTSPSWDKGYQTMGDLVKKSAAASVLNALKGIPEDLKYIFVPQGPEELLQFETNVLKFVKRAKDREEAMRIQKKYGLSLRPNMSVRYLMIFIRIAELRKRRNNPPSFDKPGDKTE